MNCMLGSTIHLGFDVIMTFRQSSHKSKIICYFKIAALLTKIVLW